MSKLTPTLKKMLSGLACQDLGDYLPFDQKLTALGANLSQEVAAEAVGNATVQRVQSTSHQRIALVTDGADVDAALEFAFDACLRHDASLDLVMPRHDRPRERLGKNLAARGRRRGIVTRLIPLATDEIQQLTEYVRNHPTLVYLVTTPGNELARQFMEQMLPARRNRLTVPLVMIGEQPVQQLKSVSTL